MDWFIGKTVNIFVIWAMLGIVLWFMSSLPITKMIGEPLFKAYVSASKKAVALLVSLCEKVAAWLVKLAINLCSWVARHGGWLLANIAIWCLNRLRVWLARRNGRAAPAPMPYRPQPAWVNHFPKKRSAHGHGHGGSGGGHGGHH